jgi:hypothetical protein
LLEQQNFTAHLAEFAGKPLDRVLKKMPAAATAGLNRVVEVVVRQCLDLAINSIETASRHPPARHMSSLLAAINGGVSGFFGLAALPIELPVTTTLMLRAIADVARHQGEDLSQLEARLACLEVFALGTARAAPRMDVGYYACRTLLSKLAANASFYLAERSVPGTSAAVANSFVTEIASRFGIVVSERVAAGALPVLGAIGGATINLMFMNHFQRVAQGHFTIRRLERIYGHDVVRRQYEQLPPR